MAGKPDGKGGGKGGGNDGSDGGSDPPVTAPVTYTIEWLVPPAGMSYSPMDINDNGFVSGIMNTVDPYDTNDSQAIVLAPDGTRTELNIEAPLGEGYFMYAGGRINNSGVVAGAAYNPSIDQWRSYRFCPAGILDEVPVAELLADTQYLPGLNESGEVACVSATTGAVRIFPTASPAFDLLDQQGNLIYASRIYDFAISDETDPISRLLYEDVSGTCVRFTVDLGSLSFPGYTAASMNEWGDIAASVPGQKKRWGAQVTYIEGIGESYILEQDDDYPNDINKDGVVVGHASQNGFGAYVYFPESGVWNVNDLVLDGGDAKWQSAGITLEAINASGQIAGRAAFYDDNPGVLSEAFILTPVTP